MNASKTSVPNIVLVMVESWDGRVIGCLGDPALENATPNLDRFAAKGALFQNNYTSHPICCPARANLWSGQYTFRCKSWNNHKGLERGTTLLTDVLEGQGGYHVARKGPGKIGFGKNDYWSGGHTQQARVTAWTGAANIELPSYSQARPAVFGHAKKHHATDWHRCKRARKFLKAQAKRQAGGDPAPFFLYLSLTTPHPRFHTSRHWLSKINVDKVSIPPPDKQEHPVVRYQRISKAWRHGLDPDSVKKTRAIYYAMVAETDAFIGTVLDQIAKLGLSENTYVIITADHGENNMEHGLFYKMNMYESSVKTPLIVAGPGIQQGVVLDNPTSLIDLYPTILDMACIEQDKAPGPLDGQSLLPLLRGETRESREVAFAMHTGTAANTSMFMVSNGKWKYVYYHGYEPQLFNLVEDPDEIDNVAPKNPGIVAELDAKLREIVDPDAVHAEWQSYCKQSFKEWRQAVKEKPVLLFEYGARNPRATYEDVMANSYKGWTDEHAKKLEDWLES